MHHFARIGAVSNRAYRVGVAMGRAQPTEGENCSGWPQGASFSNRAYWVVAIWRSQPIEGENCSGWMQVPHFAWVGAVSNRVYRVVAMGRAQPTEGGKRNGFVKKFDLTNSPMSNPYPSGCGM